MVGFVVCHSSSSIRRRSDRAPCASGWRTYRFAGFIISLQSWGWKVKCGTVDNAYCEERGTIIPFRSQHFIIFVNSYYRLPLYLLNYLRLHKQTSIPLLLISQVVLRLQNTMAKEHPASHATATKVCIFSTSSIIFISPTDRNSI